MADIGPEHWKSHFDNRFAVEYEEFERIIDEDGENSLGRVINRFKCWEEAHLLSFNADKNSFDVVQKEWGEDTELLPTGLPTYTDMWAMGQNFRALPYLKFELGKFLYDYINCQKLDVDCVVELGGGWGRNLFDLWHAGLSSEIKLYSADNSTWGKKIALKLSSLCPDIPIVPVSFDIENPDFSFLTGEKRVLYFSHFTMMYISELKEEFFEKMTQANDKITCIHFEPMGFQISKSQGYVSLVQNVEATLRNFNRNLINVLSDLKMRGKIDLTHVYKELIPSRDRTHSTSIIIWEKMEKLIEENSGV